MKDQNVYRLHQLCEGRVRSGLVATKSDAHATHVDPIADAWHISVGDTDPVTRSPFWE